jgi:pyrroline-5-carboxylate reductase
MADRIGFVGGGRVVRIILGGFKKAGCMPATIVVSDTNEDVLKKLKSEFLAVQTALNSNFKAAGQDVVFLALHPPAMAPVLNEIRNSLKSGTTVISLAPKLTIAKISEALGGFDRIVRLIPNAPSIIGEGFNPISFSRALSGGDRAEIGAMLGALGKCPEVDEGKLEAYAILTAMGPTYLWFQLCELQKIAESFGLSRTEAETGAAEMLAGAEKTLFGSGLTAEEVIDLIPVKPLGEEEVNIKAIYHAKLEALYAKLKN